MKKVRLVIRGFTLVLRPWWSALSAFISDLFRLFAGVHTGEQLREQGLWSITNDMTDKVMGSDDWQ